MCGAEYIMVHYQPGNIRLTYQLMTWLPNRNAYAIPIARNGPNTIRREYFTFSIRSSLIRMRNVPSLSVVICSRTARLSADLSGRPFHASSSRNCH